MSELRLHATLTLVGIAIMAFLAIIAWTLVSLGQFASFVRLALWAGIGAVAMAVILGISWLFGIATMLAYVELVREGQ